ncbi:MAG TPA: hypothetical protein VH352_07120 [Pseudonocardiaceae bacterium]|nr:hypothetical protein [Pseudonocardiaceae bacterium]
MTEPNDDATEREDLAELARLRARVDEVDNPLSRRIDPGMRAMVISVCVLLLAIAALLPWVQGAAGWQVLFDQGAGSAGKVDFLPRLFAIGVFLFGFLGSALSLGLRRWSIAWLATLGCGLFTVLGLVSIWSQQTTTSHQAGPGPGAGLVISVVVMVVLAVSWARVVWSRPGGVFTHRTD